MNEIQLLGKKQGSIQIISAQYIWVQTINYRLYVNIVITLSHNKQNNRTYNYEWCIIFFKENVIFFCIIIRINFIENTF